MENPQEYFQIASLTATHKRATLSRNVNLPADFGVGDVANITVVLVCLGLTFCMDRNAWFPRFVLASNQTQGIGLSLSVWPLNTSLLHTW